MKKIIPLLEIDVLSQNVSSIKIKPVNYPSPTYSHFDSDILPTGTFHGDTQVMRPKDLKKGYFTPKIKSYETKQRYFKTLLDVASDTPEFVLSLFDSKQIQSLEMYHYREAALRKLVKSAKDTDSLEHYQNLLNEYI